MNSDEIKKERKASVEERIPLFLFFLGSVPRPFRSALIRKNATHSSRVKGSALVVIQRRCAGRALHEIPTRKSGPSCPLARTFLLEEFESSGHSPEVSCFRRLSKLRFSSFRGWKCRRGDFACGDQRMPLDRSRSATCTIPFWAFDLVPAFPIHRMLCTGAVHSWNPEIYRKIAFNASALTLRSTSGSRRCVSCSISTHLS